MTKNSLENKKKYKLLPKLSHSEVIGVEDKVAFATPKKIYSIWRRCGLRAKT